MIWSEYLKNRWGLKNGLQVFIVLLVFAITGFSILYIKDPVFDFFHFSKIPRGFWRVMAYIGIMYPLYQVILLIVGSLFGQYRFFSNFLWKMNRRWLLLFKPKSK